MPTSIAVLGADERVAALVPGGFVDLRTADQAIPRSLAELIDAGEPALERVRRVVEFARTSVPGLIEDAGTLMVRAPYPHRRIACAGGNYAAHVAGMGDYGEGLTLPEITDRMRKEGQWGFWKVNHEVGGPGARVSYPSRNDRLDYEGEVAIVLGRRLKNVRASQVADAIWGYTLLIDWSIRDWSGHRFSQRYNLSKNFDGSTSLGPAILLAEEGRVPPQFTVETRVNGELRQRFSTADMVFSFGEIVEYLSRDLTLLPGDIISGGTGAGTAQDSTPRLPDGTRAPDRFLHIGDSVEVRAEGIGSIANTVTAVDPTGA